VLATFHTYLSIVDNSTSYFIARKPCKMATFSCHHLTILYCGQLHLSQQQYILNSCCVTMATVVTRTFYSVSLDFHCLSCLLKWLTIGWQIGASFSDGVEDCSCCDTVQFSSVRSHIRLFQSPVFCLLVTLHQGIRLQRH